MIEQKIKQDTICIGHNIKRIRKNNGITQIKLITELQLRGVHITRESLVKIERGTQHLYASQLKAIRETLQTTYDDLLS